MYGVRPYAVTPYAASAGANAGLDIRDPLCTDGLITLWQIDLGTLGGPVFYFTSAEDADTTIVWGGQEYAPLPMQAEGFEMTTKGTMPQPTITFSNLFGAGNLLLDTYAGLVGASITRVLTLRRFLDDGTSPDPTAWISRDVYVVAQKTSHTALAIAFKMASRLDQQGTQLPARQILRDTCSHTYRFWDADAATFNYSKATCPYTDVYSYDALDNPTTDDRDLCSRTFTGCTRRFQTLPLPARFFPGVGKVR